MFRKDEDTDNRNDHKKPKSKLRRMIIVVFLITIAIVGVVISNTTLLNQPEKKTEIITSSKLEKIVNISELNTFQAVYNGIAKVMNEKKPEKVDYYVSYEAKVYAGFDFDDLKIIKNDNDKKIIVTVPKIEIKDVVVDIASLDFMFQEKKADKSGVSEQAFKACIEDATNESSGESKIYDLAEQNAKNIIEALINPFIEQFDSEYELEIN